MSCHVSGTIIDTAIVEKLKNMVSVTPENQFIQSVTLGIANARSVDMDSSQV